MNTNGFGEFFALCKKAGFEASDRAAMCRQYSGNRTGSLKELHPIEYTELLAALRSQNLTKSDNYQKPEVSESVKKMRSKVLYLAAAVLDIKDEKGDIIWPRFNAFMLSRSYLKKALNKYTAEELPALVTQMDKMKKNTIAGNRRKLKIS